MPRLLTAMKEPIQLDGNIQFFVKIDEPRVRIWFGIAENLEVYSLLGTSFIDRKILEIFSSERNVLPWYIPPVRILPRNIYVAVHLYLTEQDRTKLSLA